jgi:hypothetical protein
MSVHGANSNSQMANGLAGTRSAAINREAIDPSFG